VFFQSWGECLVGWLEFGFAVVARVGVALCRCEGELSGLVFFCVEKFR